MSFRSGILIFFGLIIAAGLGVAGYSWYQSRNAEDLYVTLTAPDNVLVGAPFDATLQVKNDSRTVLKRVELTLELPSGIVFVGTASDRTVLAKEIGDVGAGGLYEESFKMMVVEGENTIKQVKAIVAYQPGSLGSRFMKDAVVEIPVSAQALRLELTAPQKTFSGEEIEFKVSYENVSPVSFSGVELDLEYPPAFSFTSASVKPDTEPNLWEIGELPPGRKGEIVVRGVIAGPEGSFYGFNVALSANIFGKRYIVSKQSASVTISASPISLAIEVNGGTEFVARPGDGVNYKLTYRNNTDVALRDVIVRAKLTGVMFDIPSVSSDGFLRSPESTVVWTAANTPDLALLAPRASGFVDFSVSLKPEYPIRRLSDKDFTLKVESEIESPTVPPFVGAKKTVGQARFETKVQGAIAVDARGLFRDAASGIVNRGLMPPKVGTPTQFTIHWLLTNYGTDVSTVELQGFLGGNVRFTGVVKSSIDVLPEYNNRTQGIEWKIPKVRATKGVIDKPLEAIFQVELTPGENQIGGTPTLVQRLIAHATDDFTGKTLNAEDGEIQTNLPDDATIENGAVIR